MMGARFEPAPPPIRLATYGKKPEARSFVAARLAASRRPEGRQPAYPRYQGRLPHPTPNAILRAVALADGLNQTAIMGPTHVELWGGWSIVLPTSHYQRNEDGSWSAWGEDWAVDIHIIETSGDSQGEPVSAEQFLAQNETVRGERISGNGWIGTTKTLIKNDGSRDVYRLAGRLGAKNSLMSCWVSYVRKEQQIFALHLINAVNHHSDGRVA